MKEGGVWEFVLLLFFPCLLVTFFVYLSMDGCNKRRQDDQQKECDADCRPFAAEVVTGRCFCYDAMGALHPKEAMP